MSPRADALASHRMPPALTRTSVTPSVRHPRLGRCLVVALVLAHLLAGMTLAASPRLHHWVHPDADGDDHDCAVVLFLHGGCGQAPLDVVLPVCADLWEKISPLAFRPVRVASVFAVSAVLEHAPPFVGRVSTVLFLPLV